MIKPLNVLSLFDGMSCGRLALDRAAIPVNMYMASEVDKYAIKVATANWPDTVQLGDVCGITAKGLPKVDLLLAGSPCQGFSFAGKQLAFEDDRSKLFFEFVRILKELKEDNPEIKFLLENVKMKKEYQDVISGILGMEPIEINSALVSAQNRKRDYWTNIQGVVQPEDRGILLKDILECETSEYVKISRRGQYKKHQNKAGCLSVGGHGCGDHSDMDLIGRPIEVGHAIDIQGHDIIKRIYSKYGKSPTLTAMSGGNQHKKFAINDYEYRRYTPIECERLQTVPDDYTDHVSNTQRYKMLGNGWTIDVISHILSFMV